MKRVLAISLVAAAGAAAVVSVAIARLLRDQPPMSLAEQVDDGLRNRKNGWWVRLVLDTFRYLETDFGYSLAEVQMHFRGNCISYRGPVFELMVEYDPESTRSIGAELWVVADFARGGGEPVEHPRVIDVNRLLHVRDPEFSLTAARCRGRLDRDNVSEAVSMWARGLRELAPDVLRGAWPDNVSVGYLW